MVSNIHPWNFGDRVVADGDHSLVMTVTAFQYRRGYLLVEECSYFADSLARTAWIEDWRVSLARKQ